MLLIPKAFADEAVAAFPSEVSKLTEAECETFYDDRHGSRLEQEKVDESALKRFVVREQAGETLTPEQASEKAKALDPDDPTPGIVKNPRRTWADYKAWREIKVVQ